MKRFGSIFPFVESGAGERHIGRLVANHDFVKALLRYGDFDEFLFANTSVCNLRAFGEMAEGWGLPPARRSSVKLVAYPDLPAQLSSRDFHAFHLGGWGYFMAGLHFIRARFARNPWPITGVTHSLNGRDVTDHAVRVAHAGLSPSDAIICTSQDGMVAMRRLLDAAARVVGRRFSGQLAHVPLGLDDDLLTDVGDRARGRARLRIAADAVVLLVLGRMTPTQKMDLGPLVRLLARTVLPRAERPVVLLLAGSASPQDLRILKRDIESCGIQDHVRVFPNFPLEQKADLLAMADILVSPVDNTQETFGLSLLEAMGSAPAGRRIAVRRLQGPGGRRCRRVPCRHLVGRSRRRG